MELFDRVIHSIEGEDPPRTYQTQRGPIVVRRAAFVEWAQRIERTSVPTALDCVVLVTFKLGHFSVADERRIVDGWSKALQDAAANGTVVPRDPVTLLPLAKVGEDWADWGLSLADADKFVSDLGMTWTVTEIAQHMIAEANSAMAHEYEKVAGSREVTRKQAPPPATTDLNWKEQARLYATEAWDARRQGSNPSKKAIAELVRKRFENEQRLGARGPLSKETILRDALNIWTKPRGAPKK